MELKYIGIGVLLAAVYLFIRSKTKTEEKQYMSHDAHDDEDVEVLAQSGRKLAAIKAYRKLHGVDLKQAKEAVEVMLEKGFHDSHHVDDDMNLSANEKILRAAKSGHKIAAVKTYKLMYGVSLKEAKEAVDKMVLNDRSN